MADFFFGFDTTLAVSRLILTESTFESRISFEEVENGPTKAHELVPRILFR